MIHPYASAGRRLSGIIAALAVFSACSAKTALIHELNNEYPVKYFFELSYDEFGAPHFNGMLNERPVKVGDSYFAVIFSDTTPQRYFTIGIFKSSDRPDFRKPFNVIYEWTGRGFRTGHDDSRDLIQKNMELASAPGRKGCASLFAAPGMAVGSAIFLANGAGGFIVGLHESVSTSVEEFKKLGIRKEEVVIGYNTIEYDSLNRIMRFTSFTPPPEEKKLSETSFYYRGNETHPSKSVNYSIPENKTRIIYNAN